MTRFPLNAAKKTFHQVHEFVAREHAAPVFFKNYQEWTFRTYMMKLIFSSKQFSKYPDQINFAKSVIFCLISWKGYLALGPKREDGRFDPLTDRCQFSWPEVLQSFLRFLGSEILWRPLASAWTSPGLSRLLRQEGWVVDASFWRQALKYKPVSVL